MSTHDERFEKNDLLAAESVLRFSASAACVAVVAMLAIFLFTGVGQDPLQFVHSETDYARILLKGPSALRATIAFDNMFVALYTTAFVALAVILSRSGAPRVLVSVATGFLLLLGLLDLVENMHFLVMLNRAELGLMPTAGEIEAQVIESLVKFHVSYVGLFLLGFALPRRSKGERALANMSWFLQLPVGVAIYVAPAAIATPLVFVRFIYFVAALVILAATLGRGAKGRQRGLSVSAREVGSGAPA